MGVVALKGWRSEGEVEGCICELGGLSWRRGVCTEKMH